jgi:DNA-directed RNA polymerase specialized sigma24 family protein
MSDFPTRGSQALSEVAGLPDRELMVRYHDGDARAGLALLERYVGLLLNVALRATGLRSAAEEAARDVLAGSIGGLESGLPESCRPAGAPDAGGPARRWIVDLARALYRQLAAQGFDPRLPARPLRISPRRWEAERLELSAEAKPSPRRAAQGLRRRLARAFSSLTMQQRFVIALAEWAQLAPAELAQVLGAAEPAARQVRDEAKLALLTRLAAKSQGGKDVRFQISDSRSEAHRAAGQSPTGALDCAEVLPHLESYRRGPPQGGSRELLALIDEHLGRCPHCRRQLAHLKRLTAMLSAWRPRRAGTGFKIEIAEAISESVEAEARKVYGAPSLLRPRRRDLLKLSTYQRLANALALAALVFLAAAILWRILTMHPGQAPAPEAPAPVKSQSASPGG